MGLRFRKSITLCKGVRINFGKKGASVTFGEKGFHKTINTNGRVTTSIGIPGTGIYYTDSKQIGRTENQGNKKKNHIRGKRINSESNNNYSFETIPPNDFNSRDGKEPTARPFFSNNRPAPGPDEIIINKGVEAGTAQLEHGTDYFQENNSGLADTSHSSPPSSTISWDEDRYKELQKIDYKPVDYGNDFFKDSLVSINGCKTDGHASSDKAVLSDMADKIYMSKSMLPEIYARCDPEILWNDIQLGNSAEDLLMDDKTWRFCRSISKSVIDGDIDTYLQVISELAPVDDLLLYGSDFQFGTDTPLYMEIEFIVYPEELLEKGKEDSLLSQYVLAVSIRVARDLFALLPIETIIVHVMCESKDIFSGIFERKELKDLDFSTDIDSIIKYIKFRACNYTDAPVKRFGS